MTNKLLRIKSDVRGQLPVETAAAQTTWRSKVCVALLTVVVIMCMAMEVMGATVTWEAPSSVKVGQTFYVHARVDGIDASNHVGVDSSKSTGKVWEWDAAAQWKAASAGTVTFYVNYDVGSQRKESTRTVTIVSDTPTPPSPSVPTLGSVNLELTSTSVAPGETVVCSLSAYSTTGASITSGTKSWSISSITNDAISSSGALTIAPIPILRTVTVTGTCSYNGVTKSAVKTVSVVPVVVQTPTIEPVDGTVIGDSQSVLISCEDADAIVYYTIDGSEPTEESMLYQRRFRVSGRTTIKAVAIQEGKANSEVAVAHYALGQCPDPVIVSARGERFTTDENLVSISWDCADGVLRYTLDGSEVSEASLEYKGPFTIDKTTTIKAKAFGETYFDSNQVELTVYSTCRIIDVTAQQRYPRDGLVDVVVNFSGSSNNLANVECSFVATNSETQAALVVTHITRDGNDSGDGNAWTRRYVWDVAADVGAVKIDDIVLTVKSELSLGGVQLWENGPYWAECNVGANKPEEYGYYFWWGDTVGYTHNGSSWDAVDGSKTGFSFEIGNCPTYNKSISDLLTAGYIDSTGNLVAEHDAATAYRGSLWRMPTSVEIDELIENCETEWSLCNGVPGRYVRGRGEFSSKSIFLPAAGAGSVLGVWEPGSYGRYWSSSPDSASLTPEPDRFNGGRNLCFGLNESPSINNDRRESGQNVRPVREAAPTETMSTHLPVDCTVRLLSVTAQQRYPWNGLVDIIVTFYGGSNDVVNVDCSFVATNTATLAALPVVHITREGNDSGVGYVLTRRYVWDAAVDVGEVRIDDVVLTVEATLGGVQLWEKGPYWARQNLGAVNPEEYGYYYWWGDTVGYVYKDGAWISSTGVNVGNSPFDGSSTCPTWGARDSELQSKDYMDPSGKLTVSHDAATVRLGALWRMPTAKDFSALISNCDTEWTVRNGVYGRLVKGRGKYASESIFLPAAGRSRVSSGKWGYYSASTRPSGAETSYSGDNIYVNHTLYFGENDFDKGWLNMRRDSLNSIRPLRDVDNVSVGSAMARMSLDSYQGVRDANSIEKIKFSPTWEIMSKDATVTVTLDGVTVTNATEAGSFEWIPTRNGTYRFSHAVFTNGVQVGDVQEATFVVNGFTPTISPGNGTIFESSLSVLMKCPFVNADIFYTLDGSEPTADSLLYQNQICISEKTTIKAIAACDGEVSSEVVVAHYAHGQCPDPVIMSSSGETFRHGSVQVLIDWECADGVLRYTTDGSDVTETSPVYTGPFTIADTTTIKAKAFGETYFDSKQVELTVTREWESVVTPIITAAESFSGSKTTVSISCAVEDATIRYTTDGSEPNSGSTPYSGPFKVRESTVVKAFATLADYKDSEVATKMITKVWGIGDSVGLPDHSFTTDGDAEWVNDGGTAMRSGKITHKQTSVLRSTFVGKGRLTFELKTSCEEDDPEYMEYDRAEVWMDGALKMKQDGEHDWKTFEFDLDGDSTTVEWRYVKDELDDAKYPGEDCIWVRNIVWLPELTCTTEEPVELNWIREKFGDLGNYYYAYEEKAKEIAANGHKVWECYVAGEDPTNKDSRFTAIINIGPNGKPILSWKPPLNGETADGAGIREGVRKYSLYGKQTLDDAAEEWAPVAEGDEGNYHFFKIGVEMP